MPTPDNLVIVLFGATGDLAKRKLLPGLFRLATSGCSRGTSGSSAAPVGISDERVPRPRPRVVSSSAAQAGRRRLGRLRRPPVVRDQRGGRPTISPRRWPGPARTSDRPAARCSTCRSRRWPSRHRDCARRRRSRRGATRVVLEKPFGTDLDSATALNALLHSVFDRGAGLPHRPLPGQGGRAEHPRGALRQRAVRAGVEPRPPRLVQIDVPETLGVEDRAKFYDGTGAFRDMVVTHLFQVLGFVTMEPPSVVHRRRPGRGEAAVFDALQPLDPTRVVRGQYDGYRDSTACHGLRHRDVRRGRGSHRQRALGRRAVLPAHRQAHAPGTACHHAHPAASPDGDVRRADPGPPRRDRVRGR